MSPATKSTAFVLVPGSFSPNTFYEKVIPLLQKEGYEAYPTPLLSCGQRDKGPATMQEDAALIHNVVSKLADDGKDVVIAMNSYGGFPGTESSKGLSKSERQKEDKKGGLVGLVYLASFIPPVGMSLRGLMGDSIPDSIKKAGEYMYLNPEEDYKNIFSDFPEAQGRAYMAQMPHHSTISFSGELTYPGYKYIPATYLVTEGDKIIPPEHQRQMIAFAKGEGVILKVDSTEAGHVPMLGAPEKVVEVLIGAANES
ncbi:hypothetical protein ACEPPN_019149 [Leptodophora sp. 'Broadleaf-Isolate-01']